MSVAGRKKRGRLRIGKLWAGLALLSYSLTGLGIPLPATNIKDHSIHFPCEDHACGCQSAEQCWQHCCCFSAEERWAWARSHHVEPPAYAERPHGEQTVHAHPTLCCHDHQSHPTKVAQAKPHPSVRWVLGLSALQCSGLTTSWISLGALAPPPPVIRWSPCLLPAGWVLPAELFPFTLAICPLDPPPR